MGNFAVITAIVGLAQGDVLLGGQKAGVGDVAGENDIEGIVTGAEDFDFAGRDHAMQPSNGGAIARAI